MYEIYIWVKLVFVCIEDFFNSFIFLFMYFSILLRVLKLFFLELLFFRLYVRGLNEFDWIEVRFFWFFFNVEGCFNCIFFKFCSNFLERFLLLWVLKLRLLVLIERRSFLFLKKVVWEGLENFGFWMLGVIFVGDVNGVSRNLMFFVFLRLEILVCNLVNFDFYREIGI